MNSKMNLSVNIFSIVYEMVQCMADSKMFDNANFNTYNLCILIVDYICYK